MNVLDKRIPTLLAVIFLIIGVVVTSILVQRRIIIFQNAAPSENPQNVRITNISDIAFTVTYTTDASVIGTISVRKNGQQPQVTLDERDQQSGIPKPYTVHSIFVKNLTPQTPYSFTILSGTTTYLNGETPFSITTAPSLTTPPIQQAPLAGKLLMPDGSKPDEALVFVTTQNGQLLSTLLNAAGLYIIPLNAMRTKDLSSAMQFSSTTPIQILAQNSTNISHVITTLTAINPMPPITLSQDYDFTIGTTPLASASATANFPILSFTQHALQPAPEITTPKDNESFTDTQPQFKGTAAPNSTVTISIHSDAAVTTQITADSNGNWIYRPSTPLQPGQHTITITTPDQYGILHTLTQNFTVFASGTQVSQPATPSATLTQPATPTPTIGVTLIPTATIPTPTSAITPTITPPNSSGFLTPRPTLPPTGSNTVAVAGIAGIATTIIGIVLFLITNGAM